MDQSKKTMRHFYCRDVLWETFEQMANDFDCSIDYLVNEAMRFYARSKNYQRRAAPPSSPSVPQQRRRAARTGRRSGAGNGAKPLDAAARPAGDASADARRRRAPATGARPPAPSPRAEPGYAGAAAASARARRSAPPPNHSRHSQRRRRADTGRTAMAPARRCSWFQQPALSRRRRISSSSAAASKTSDLAIKDGNISRKHAAVIRRNGMFYIKDLGSTNGIDYKGMRIDNKRIDEGDIFHICDYELRFTYRPTGSELRTSAR